MAQPAGIAAATEWLDAFATAVAEEDYAGGEALFSPTVTAYGTRTPFMTSLGQLEADQWKPVWSTTRGFRFVALDSVSDLGDGFAVAARWESFSRGSGQRRTGRCSLVLRGSPLRCSHSHFSMTPAPGDEATD